MGELDSARYRHVPRALFPWTLCSRGLSPEILLPAVSVYCCLNHLFIHSLTHRSPSKEHSDCAPSQLEINSEPDELGNHPP